MSRRLLAHVCHTVRRPVFVHEPVVVRVAASVGCAAAVLVAPDVLARVRPVAFLVVLAVLRVCVACRGVVSFVAAFGPGRFSACFSASVG
ncbi:hypothetical protein [Streptomyces sp. NPDC059743]|uniref:hypothetical protein n=1 Tax=Streptomyces sp. NPDC059743 TaxID=3346928 RepID=UPI00365C4341